MDIEKRLIELQSQLDELKSHASKKPGFEVGKWYKHLECACLFNYQGLGKYGAQGFGWNPDSVWDDYNPKTDIHWGRIKSYRPATQSEVGAALIAEATKRGFKEGARIKSTRGSLATLETAKITYYDEADSLVYGGGMYYLYENGQWAEIVKNEVTIAGHEVHYNSETIVVDGKIFSREELNCAAKLLANVHVVFIQVGCQSIHWNDIDKILNNWKCLNYSSQ